MVHHYGQGHGCDFQHVRAKADVVHLVDKRKEVVFPDIGKVPDLTLMIEFDDDG